MKDGKGENDELHTETARELALVRAIHAVMRDAAPVESTGETTEGRRYTFATHADVIAGARKLMAEHGLILVPDAMAAETVGHGTQWATRLVVTWHLIHTGGASRILQTIGAGIDPGDKGPYKAMTGALKYALRILFLLEVPPAEDPDVTASSAQKQTGPLEVGLELLEEVIGKAGLHHDQVNDWLTNCCDPPRATLEKMDATQRRAWHAWLTAKPGKQRKALIIRDLNKWDAARTRGGS